MPSVIEGLINRPVSTPVSGIATPSSGIAVPGASPSAALPTVANPDTAYANITRAEYDDYINGFRGFETDLIARAQNDTSLIDQAKVDAPNATKLATDIAERNRSRYGVSYDPSMNKERARSSSRLGSLAYDGAVNNARIDQDTLNTNLLSGLIDIGQGVNSTSQDQLSASAQNASALNQAYRSARSDSRNQTTSMIGSLGATALMALAV